MYRRMIKSKNFAITLQQNIIQIIENRYEPIEEPKEQINRILIKKKLAVKVIMVCRTILAHKFRTRFGFQTVCHFNRRTFSVNKNNKFI